MWVKHIMEERHGDNGFEYTPHPDFRNWTRYEVFETIHSSRKFLLSNDQGKGTLISWAACEIPHDQTAKPELVSRRR